MFLSITVTYPGDVKSMVGENLIRNPGRPKILLPTTSGSASEATNIVVISIEDEQIKSGIVTPHNFADVAIVDPMMTITVPAKTTAPTGLDALSHAVEACMSREAIRLIAENLRLAYIDGQDLKARYAMSLSALLSGLAFGNAGVCGGHAAAHAVKYKAPHGVSCALALNICHQCHMDSFVLTFELASC